MGKGWSRLYHWRWSKNVSYNMLEMRRLKTVLFIYFPFKEKKLRVVIKWMIILHNDSCTCPLVVVIIHTYGFLTDGWMYLLKRVVHLNVA